MTGRVAVTSQPGRPGPSARAGASLLEQLQGVIERTYRMSTGIEDVGRFILGDDGYRRVYGSVRPVERVEKVAKVLASGWNWKEWNRNGLPTAELDMELPAPSRNETTP